MITNGLTEQQPRLKVAMVEPVGGYGGNEFYDFGLCEALGKYCEVGFYTCTETMLGEKHHLKTKTYKFYKNIYGHSSLVTRGIRYFWGALRTAIHAKKQHVDIVHIHIYHFAWRELVVAFLCKIFSMKVVATIHDVESLSAQPQKKIASLQCKKFLPFIDSYLVHSRYAFENLSSLTGQKVKDHLHIVPHGDTDFLYKGNIDKRDAKKSLLLPLDKKLILFFGQIKKVKGLDVLLNAFSSLSKSDSSYHLLIIGRPWKFDGEALKRKILELGIEHRVTLNMSYIRNEDVPAYFVAADLVVLPYLKIYSSGVLLRALDYGTPVVVSDLSPLTDIVQDGENGRVFRSGDSEHLMVVIKEVIDDASLLKKYAKSGKKTINDKYSWDVVAKETISIYRETLQQ